MTTTVELGTHVRAKGDIVKKNTTVKKHRINLELTSQVMARLNSLVEESDSESKTDVVRKALALYETMARLRKEEGRVVFLLKNGTQRELVF